jgi:phage-related protein
MRTDEPAGPKVKPLFWVSGSLNNLRKFPGAVRRTMGFALWQAQKGGKHLDAKPLKGFGGAGVLEIVESRHGNAYRAVYTVRFAGAVYVLHAFQKKSKSGVKTPIQDKELIRKRLKMAEEQYEAWHPSE